MAERNPGSPEICALALCFSCGPRYYEPTHPQIAPWVCLPCAYSDLHDKCWDGCLDRVSGKELVCYCPCQRK